MALTFRMFFFKMRLRHSCVANQKQIRRLLPKSAGFVHAYISETRRSFAYRSYTAGLPIKSSLNAIEGTGVHDVITSCLLCAVSLCCSSTTDQTGYDLTFAPKQEVVLQVAASLLLED